MAFLITLARVTGIVLVTILFVACGPAGVPAPATTPTAPEPKAETKASVKEPVRAADSVSGGVAKVSSKEAEAMARYEALVQAAKKEGKVAVSNSQAFVRDALRDSFGKKFGIDVEFLHLSAGDMFTRLRTERQAGQYNLDVAFTGGVTLMVNMMPEGFLDRLDDVVILPEATDPTKWVDGQIAWADPEHRAIRLNKYVASDLLINTSSVKRGEIKAYKDLLNPSYKGKIAAHDPTVPGGGGTAATFMLVAFGEDFIKQLFLGQEVAYSREFRQMEDWVGRGKYSILIWGGDPAEIDKMQKDGMPVEVPIPEDSAAVHAGWGGMGLVNKAPHPNAAKLLVNWLASREGQQMWVNMTKRPVTRVDVDPSATPEYIRLKPGVKYFDMFDYTFVTSQQSKAEKRLRELIPR